jgi:hypothetical protein
MPISRYWLVYKGFKYKIAKTFFNHLKVYRLQKVPNLVKGKGIKALQDY